MLTPEKSRVTMSAFSNLLDALRRGPKTPKRHDGHYSSIFTVALRRG
jgi:hypothetical protein